MLARNTAECIAFVNHKGGSGKTSLCISIAGFLVKKGKKVLVVDLDPQANATLGLGIDVKSVKISIYDAVLNLMPEYDGVPITKVIIETKIENLHLAPSEIDLAAAEVLINHSKGKTDILNKALEHVKRLYDYILIDLPPSSGLLTINGICSSNQVIVPLEPSIYSLETLYNLKNLFNNIKRSTNHKINQITVVLNRYLKPNILLKILHRSNPSQEVKKRLKEMIISLFIIPESTKIFHSQYQGIPISHYSPYSKVGKAYEKLAIYIINNRRE